MANANKKVAENVPGDFFVDATCIDCDACRQIAPAVFGEAATTSFVYAQPAGSADRRRALQALLSCPTGSIGCLGPDDVKAVMADFPLALEEPVYYCGFNSPKSYGGNSYFIRLAGANWLIDAPKFVMPLVRRLEVLGGVDHIFLTHRDDVADADRYARHFGSRRIIHRAELSSQPGAEVVLDGEEPIELCARLYRHSHAWPYQRTLRSALSGPLPVHRGSPGLGPGQKPARGLGRLLLVFMAGTNQVDGTVSCVPICMGTAGAWPARMFARSRHEPGNGSTGEEDGERGSVAAAGLAG